MASAIPRPVYRRHAARGDRLRVQLREDVVDILAVSLCQGEGGVLLVEWCDRILQQRQLNHLPMTR